MKTALIENGVVVQVQPPIKTPVLDGGEVVGYTEQPADGFIEVDNLVCCGMIANDDGTFSNPPPAPKTQEEQIADLEATITPRNLRGAALGDNYSITKIERVEAAIAELRV